MFDTTQLRPHLLACIERGEIEPFPSRHVNRKVKSKKVEVVKVFCICRTQEGGKMLECSTCLEWFHKECLVVANLSS